MPYVFGGIAGVVVGILLGVIIGIAYRKRIAEAEIGSAELQARKILEEGIKTVLETAKAKFDAEESVYNEFIEFTELLTNSAMFAEKNNASKATQRLAIALSKEWIIEAYNDKVAELRAKYM